MLSRINSFEKHPVNGYYQHGLLATRSYPVRSGARIPVGAGGGNAGPQRASIVNAAPETGKPGQKARGRGSTGAGSTSLADKG